MTTDRWIHAGTKKELKDVGAKVIRGGIAVFYHEDQVYALDNRCPHMGFPLHMGSLCNGILTCHWHHARFDVCSGGTLDPWADDVPTYEIKIDDDEFIWVNPQPKQQTNTNQYMERLQKGLEQNISLVIAKAVVALIERGVPESEIIRAGVQFGTNQNRNGWQSGLTILSAMANILPKLDKQGKILALYQGLVHVARDCAGSAQRHLLGPLPGYEGSPARLAEWYRQCIEVRDTQGAERVVATAIKTGMSMEDLSAMLMTAVTDHFYMSGGHALDFHNKAFEALEHAGEDLTELVLTSLTPMMSSAGRSEELNSWRAPLNLVSPLMEAFEILANNQPADQQTEIDAQALLDMLLGEEPLQTIETLTDLLLKGASPVHIAQIVTLAAMERVVRFHTQNDFADWNTVHHTFSHAHAVHESLRRSNDPMLVRAIYHAAVTVYHDRFLNVPAAKRPEVASGTPTSDQLNPERLLEIMDRQQQVDASAAWVLGYVHHGGNIEVLFNTLGMALLREDANFHTYQIVEAAFREYDRWDADHGQFAERAKETALLAVTRYLAAHAPTSRELPHTARIALRLHRGEKLFEEEKTS